MKISGHHHSPVALPQGKEPHLRTEKEARWAPRAGLGCLGQEKICYTCREPYHNLPSSNPHLDYVTVSTELQQKAVNLPHHGRAMAQAVSGLPLTAEARV
jgi:hypothetical protein